MIDEVCMDGGATDPCLDPENVESGNCGSGGSGTGSGSGSGFGANFDPANFYNGIGEKPFHEFTDKCAGLQFMWDNYPKNEVHGYITSAGNLIVTEVLELQGGFVKGLYAEDGKVYYAWPYVEGQPSVAHPDIFIFQQNYYIPVVASIHTHILPVEVMELTEFLIP